VIYSAISNNLLINVIQKKFFLEWIKFMLIDINE
jgi:hypothetical protein